MKGLAHGGSMISNNVAVVDLESEKLACSNGIIVYMYLQGD